MEEQRGKERSKEAVTPPAPRETERKPTEGAPNPLDQLREILFGAVQHDLERRLGRIDAHLAARAQELDQESRRRVDILETHLRRETETLAARLEREFAETSGSLRSMTRQQRETVADLEQRVANVEESVARAQRELRQQLLEQAKSFLDEISRLRADLVATLEREIGLSESQQLEEPARHEPEKRH